MNTNDQLYLPGNNGKAVLLMHGLTSGAAQMVPMARFLSDYGYTVRCVNLAGHGTYPEDLLHTTAEDLIAKAEYDYAQLCRRGIHRRITVAVSCVKASGIGGNHSHLRAGLVVSRLVYFQPASGKHGLVGPALRCQARAVSEIPYPL